MRYSALTGCGHPEITLDFPVSRRSKFMDLRFTPEELAFREEVRTFIRENLPADTR